MTYPLSQLVASLLRYGQKIARVLNRLRPRRILLPPFPICLFYIQLKKKALFSCRINLFVNSFFHPTSLLFQKMPKRSNRLPLLAILCFALAILCVAAILIWVNFGRENGGEERQNLATLDASKKGEENEAKTTNMAMANTTTSNILTTTMATERTTENEKEEEMIEASTSAWTLAEIGGHHQQQHAPICLEPTMEESRGECQPVAAGSSTASSSSNPPNVDLLRPFEYSLNISLSTIGQPMAMPLRGQLSILAELTGAAGTLALNFDQNLAKIDENHVRIWDCQRGIFLCLRSLTHLSDQQLILLELVDGPLPAGSIVRLQFLRLNLPLFSPALLVQIPSPWERDRAWILGTQLPLAGGARHLFPSVDSANARAVLRLCLIHQMELIARANTLSALSEEIDESNNNQQQHQIRTCFKETPALPPAQFAFLLFRNLKQIPAIGNLKAEMFIGNHLQPEDYAWVLEEAEKAMKRMEQFTGVAYPAERLTLISSPLAPGNDTVGGLGLAQIRDSWIEYPKFVHTHNLLIGQIVRQWTANLLSICDECVQRGIGLFLEWILAAELGPAEDKAAEFRRRIGEARQRLLGTGGGQQQLRATTSPDQCAERAAFLLHSLDRAFGRSAMTNFFISLFRRHSWDSKCTTTRQLSALFVEANGQGHPEAQQVFDSAFFSIDESSSSKSNSTSSSIPPLLHFNVQPQLSQLILYQQLNNQPNKTIPIEIADDTGKMNKLVMNQTKMTFPMIISLFLLAQPSSFARFTYNVENYLQLSKCIGQEQSGKCPSIDRLALRDAVNDLCWCRIFTPRNGTIKALLQQKLTPIEAQLPLWRQLFHSLSARGAVRGDCACCMMPKADALKGHCRWTWLDKCSRIELLALLN